MPQKSPFTLDIPKTDVLSYVFPEGKTPSDKPIWIDADDPSNFLSPRGLLCWVKRLGVGLDKLKIKQNEAVLMYSSMVAGFDIVSNSIPLPGSVGCGVASRRVGAGCWRVVGAARWVPGQVLPVELTS